MHLPSKPGRRAFVGTLTKTIGTSLLVTSPVVSRAASRWTLPPPLTVGQLIESIIRTIPDAPFPKTVDSLKAGSPDIVVTGIVSTMFATVDVIRKAIALKANFIIAHEPTFYNHTDETNWLEEDAVFRYKQELLTKNNIAVWRFHDYLHAHRPDGVQTGVATSLGWNNYADPKNPRVFTLPAPLPLSRIITHAKAKLGIQTMRVVGDVSQSCRRVLLLPGAAGGRSQITALQQTRPDVLLCGEVSEWETAEYVRDARAAGQPLSLVVLGHEMSEDPGMEWVVTWLKDKVSGLPVTHISSGNPFSYA